MHWEGGERTAIRIGGENTNFFKSQVTFRKHDPLKCFRFAQPLSPKVIAQPHGQKRQLVNEPTVYPCRTVGRGYVVMLDSAYLCFWYK